MANENEIRNRVDQFILDQIDSVSQLEALLLLWSRRPKPWTPDDMGKALYVKSSFAERILKDLMQRGLAAESGASSGLYAYDSSSEERNNLVQAVDIIYRREIVRISTLIHSKGSVSMREFAKAFRFTKDREQ